MRLDFLYTFGALWSASADSQVCTVNPYAPSEAVHATYDGGWLPALEGVTAFVGVNVVPMDRERVLSNYTVLVEDGRITTLGPSDKVQVPAGAVRIDGWGKYLMPGLANMHEHNWNYDHRTAASYFYDIRPTTTGPFYDERNEVRGPLLPDLLFRELATGVTTIRHHLAEGPMRQAFRDSMKLAVASPRVYFGAYQPASVARAEGYDFILLPKTIAGIEVTSPQARAAIDSFLSVARQEGLPVVAHNHAISFDMAPTLGAHEGAVDHLNVYYDSLRPKGWAPPDDLQFRIVTKPTGVPERELRRLIMEFMSGNDWMAPDTARFRRLAEATQRTGLWVTPTLRCIESRQHQGAPPKSVLHQLVKALQDAGVKLLLGADDGWDVHEELMALVRAGLTPYQALVTGTRNPAQHMGLLDSSGTVAVGKRADLVLLYGNPLADIRYAREPAGVMIGGQWLDRAMLDRALLFSGDLLWSAVSQPGISLGGKSPGVRASIAKIAMLSDSLAAAKPSEQARVRQRLAEELGTLRAALPAFEQQDIFDPIARAWIREQAREGYHLVISDVTPGAP